MKAMQLLDKKTPREGQRGFTLVEIAIVLVIIGLLLGGVLKGQNLINSARVRNIADQNSAIQAAYYGFIDRYRAVPGDMQGTDAQAAIGANNLVGATPPGGNGNGSIDQDYGEASAVWAHLSAANFIVGSYPGGATDDASYVVGDIAPLNAFGGRIALWRTNLYQATAGVTTSPRLAFIVGRSVPASVMAELDTKVDDGNAISGVLRATSGTGTAANQGDSTCVSTTAGTAGTWDVSADSQDCNATYLY